MYQVTIDGTVYARHDTAEAAEADAHRLRRWASTSLRIAVVAPEPAVLSAPAPCAGCGGTGEAVRLLWVGARGGWVDGSGECRACRGSGVAGEGVTAPIAA